MNEKKALESVSEKPVSPAATQQTPQAQQTQPTNTQQSHGSVNLGDLRLSISNTRTTFTRIRPRPEGQEVLREVGTQADFITLISIISALYRDYDSDLVPIQQFHAHAELYEDGGHTCVVSQRAIQTIAASNVERGATDALAEDIVVKRPRESVLESTSSGLKSFITELRIRTHPPIWQHPNIVTFKGVAWDFEDEQAVRPRPLLLEEFAPQRSLDRFWRDYNFVRMTFQSKVEFCIDIAAALSALHGSRVVHGDVKPENILVFPKIGHHDAFTAKLTDFGHSVSVHEGLTALPAFSVFWCAPEVQESDAMSFDDMIATDVYSYGLVVLSILLGRSYYNDLPDFEIHRETDTMFDHAMQLIETEDRQNHDSDFELDTIRLLLRATLKRNPKRRSLKRCIRILSKYQATQFAFSCRNKQEFPRVDLYELGSLDVEQMVSIGYQTLSLCSHQLKNCISTQLQQIATNKDDPRAPAAAWELSICYLSGFGVTKDFPTSSQWLLFAASCRVEAAEMFCSRLHRAMGITTEQALANPVRGVQSGSETEQRIRLMLEQNTDEIQPYTHDSTTREAGSETQPIGPDEAGISHIDYGGGSNDQDSDTQSDTPSVLSRKTKHRPTVLLTDELIRSVTSKDPEFLHLLENNLEYLNGQDRQGDTLLHIAARSGNYRAMCQLLDQSDIDASIYNSSQESALHLLNKFFDRQIQKLVPLLIARKADPQHEALPLQHGSSLLHFSLRIRCCPILRAVLNNNLDLLRCLLTEIHNHSQEFECRICEGGSRLRRIVTFALSTFHTKGLRVLLDHIKLHKGADTVDLSKIEVWSNRRLVPLWEIPFDNVIIKTLDLPESFFRAMYFAEDYVKELHNTLTFLFKYIVRGERRHYELLRQIVKVNNVDAVDFVLKYAKTHGRAPGWWVIRSRSELRTSPLILAVNHGLRDIFEHLHSEESDLFQQSFPIHEKVKADFMGALLLGREKACDRIVHINLAQICLFVAVSAPHQDQFFCDFILDHASRQCIINPPETFSYVIGHQPTCFLAQAILTSSLRSASTIFQRFPEAASHRIALQYAPKAGLSRVVSIANQFRSEQLEPGWSMLPRSVYASVASIASNGLTPTLPQYVLWVGSYKHCAFIVKQLQTAANAQPNTGKPRSPAVQLEDGTPDWYRHRLDPKEYHFLLLGNLMQDRKDRQNLWGFIRAQVAHGHPKSKKYLRLALKYANNQAVIELLDIGWEINGPAWQYLYTPLRLSTWLEARAHDRIIFLGTDEWKHPTWGDLDTHKRVFQLFSKQQTLLYENFEELTKRNSDTIRTRGVKIPKLVQMIRTDKGLTWTMVAYLSFYFVCLPIVLGAGAGPYWGWKGSRGIKVLWMYIYSIMAIANPPVLIYSNVQAVELGDVIKVHVLAIIQSTLQHLVPLLLVTCLHEGEKVAGRQWAWPFIILLVEFAIGAVGFIVGAGLMLAGMLLLGFGILLDCLFILILFPLGWYLKKGPVEITADWVLKVWDRFTAVSY